MSTTIPDTTGNADEEELAYTRKIRKDLVNQLNTKGPPTDLKEQSIMLQALDGLDRITLSKMRMNTDVGIGNAQLAAAATIAALYTNSKVLNYDRSATPVGTIPTLIDGLPPVDIIPGELDPPTSKDTYAKFAKRVGLDETQP
jgi:hypothetical protein